LIDLLNHAKENGKMFRALFFNISIHQFLVWFGRSDAMDDAFLMCDFIECAFMDSYIHVLQCLERIIIMTMYYFSFLWNVALSTIASTCTYLNWMLFGYRGRFSHSRMSIHWWRCESTLSVTSSLFYSHGSIQPR
jgi:hypothetical protein